MLLRSTATLLALASLAALPACSADATTGDDVGQDESEITTKIPAGTYVLRYGPSGSLSEPYASQKHVTRLTVSARNAFEAEVLKEVAQTQANPFFPWLTSKRIEKETLVRRGTMKFGTDDQGRATVDFGDDVGLFRVEAEDGDLTLTATLYKNERRTELRLDPNFQPEAPPAPVSLRCVHRHVDRGDVIEVTLDRDRNQAGKAKITRSAASLAAGNGPAAGTYTLSVDEMGTGNGWRQFDAKSSSKRMTLRFPIRDLESGRGSFDAAGAYPVGDFVFGGGDYHLSLRCTHQ